MTTSSKRYWIIFGLVFTVLIFTGFIYLEKKKRSY